MMTDVIKRVALGALGAIFVLCGLWYGLFWRTETSHLKLAKQQLEQVDQQVATDQGQVISLRAQVKLGTEEKPVLSRLVGLLPYGPSLDQLYSTIGSACSRSGVQLTSLGTPSPSGWGSAAAAAGSSTFSIPGAETLTVTFQLKGSPSQVISLINRLDHSTRLYLVTNLSMTSSGAASLTVQAFYGSSDGNDPIFPGTKPTSVASVTGTPATTNASASVSS